MREGGYGGRGGFRGGGRGGGGYGGRGGFRGGGRGGGGYGGRGGFRGGGRGGGYGGRGGGDRFSRPAPEAPVRVGEVYDVDVTEVGQQGDGLARVENFVVFVPGAQKGEHLQIRIRQVMRRFAVGERVTGDAPAEGAEPAEGSADEAGSAEGPAEDGESEESEE